MKVWGTPLWSCLAVLLLALGLVAVPAHADDPVKSDKADKKDPPKPQEKTFAFAFANQPWTQVIEWFADNTGLAFIGNYKPIGTFTFIPPKVNGELKKYTIAEIIDTLNEALLTNSTRRYVLIRRSQTFTLL